MIIQGCGRRRRGSISTPCLCVRLSVRPSALAHLHAHSSLRNSAAADDDRYFTCCFATEDRESSRFAAPSSPQGPPPPQNILREGEGTRTEGKEGAAAAVAATRLPRRLTPQSTRASERTGSVRERGGERAMTTTAKIRGSYLACRAAFPTPQDPWATVQKEGGREEASVVETVPLSGFR